MNAQHVFIGVGASIGNRSLNLAKALNALIESAHFKMLRLSSIYESEPWGGVAELSFLNGVIWALTELDPEKCLCALKEIEMALGRKKDKRWADRLIDLDLLVYGNETIHSNQLIVPHPEMLNRRFVLVPFREIAPDVIVPGTEKKISEHLRNCTDTSVVEYYSKYPTIGEAT